MIFFNTNYINQEIEFFIQNSIIHILKRYNVRYDDYGTNQLILQNVFYNLFKYVKNNRD